jgi:hypothetical protein
LQTGGSLADFPLDFGLMLTLQSLTVTLLLRKQSSTAAPAPLCAGRQPSASCSRFARRSLLEPAGQRSVIERALSDCCDITAWRVCGAAASSQLLQVCKVQPARACRTTHEQRARGG